MVQKSHTNNTCQLGTPTHMNMSDYHTIQQYDAMMKYVPLLMEFNYHNEFVTGRVIMYIGRTSACTNLL